MSRRAGCELDPGLVLCEHACCQHPFRADKRHLEESLALAPEEFRGTSCQELHVDREILAAWKEESGEGGAPDRVAGL